MFITTARRNAGLALAVALVTSACTDAAPRAFVTIRIDEERYRPDHVLLTWEAPQGSPPSEVRVPAAGELPRTGSLLATVVIDLDAAKPGERQVTVRGIRGGLPVSGATARVPWESGPRIEVTLTLGALAGPTVIDGGPEQDAAPPPLEVALEAPDLSRDVAPSPADAAADSTVELPVDAESSPPSTPASGADAAGVSPDTPAGPAEVSTDVTDEVAPPPPAGVDLDDGLVLYLKLDDLPVNGTVRDSSGNANLAMLANLDLAQTRVAGRAGHAIALAGGATPGWISVKGSPALDRITGDLSISVWVRVAADPGGPPRTILSRAASAGGALYSLQLFGNRPIVRLNSSQGSPGLAISAAVLPADRWVHLAVVYDRDHLFLYLDGRRAGAGHHRLGFPPEVTPLLIGGGPGYGGSDPFAGQLDEIAVYARALSLGEVRALADGFQPQAR